MSRIDSTKIVVLLAPLSGSVGELHLARCRSAPFLRNLFRSIHKSEFLSIHLCVAKSTVEEYRDFEEVYMEPESDSSDQSKSSQKVFLEELSNRALEAAGRSDKVVVRYVTNSPKDCQDSLVNRLIAGGALQENITVVRLSMDKGTKIPQNRSFYRTNYFTWRPKTVLA